MNILITGGAGFIGTHLSRKLKENGHSIRILDNLLSQVHGDDPDLDFDGAQFIRGDVRDLNTMNAAAEGIDIVFHLAAETGVGQSQYEIERYISTNTYGTSVVLQASVNAGVKHLLITSSRAVYGEGVHLCPDCGKRFVPKSRNSQDMDRGDWKIKCPVCETVAHAQLMGENDPISPISIYGLTKVQQEQLAAQVRQIYPMPVTNLRLFNVFGPGQSLSNPYVGVLGTFFRRITSGKGIDIYEDGQMRRDFVYVGDVAEALKLAAGNEKVFNQTINVGTGKAVTLEEAGREMFRLLGAEPQIDFSGKFRLGDIHHAVGDTKQISEKLGYVPPTTFTDGLAKFVAWAKTEAPVVSQIDTEAEELLRGNNLLRQARG